MAYISSVRALKIVRSALLERNLNSYKFSRNRKILICTFSTPNLARNTWIRKNLRQRGKLTFFPFLKKKRLDYRDILLRAASTREWDPKIQKKKREEMALRIDENRAKQRWKKSKQIRRHLTALLPTPTLEWCSSYQVCFPLLWSCRRLLFYGLLYKLIMNMWTISFIKLIN